MRSLGSKACDPRLVPVCCLVLGACGTVDPSAESERAAMLAKESAGATQVQGLDTPDLSPAAIDAVLGDGLSLREAVDLGLRNSRTLQAQWQRIGVAKAEWVRSGLPSNPVLGFSVLLPEEGGRSFVAASLVQSLLSLWNIPLRREVAGYEMEQTVLEIAHAAAKLARDVRRAYYLALSADALLEVQRRKIDLSRRTVDAVRARREAGAATELDEALALPPAMEAEAALQSARLARDEARRDLLRLLAVDLDAQFLRLVDEWPVVLGGTFEAGPLLTLARALRLDVRAQENAIRAAEAACGLRAREALGPAEVGIAFEREARRGGEGDSIDSRTGPTASVAVPVFDRGGAAAARAHYELQALRKTHEAALLVLAHEVRGAADRLKTAIALVELRRDRLLPQVRRNAEFAGEAFRHGRTTVLALIETQRVEMAARESLIEAERELAIALSALEDAVGLPLSEILRRLA